ncbi:MAG: 50S ribosomal protein L17 [Firmicutes bacterium]|nr:50S ribosomal protein L17 [Bacillota bacterium]
MRFKAPFTKSKYDNQLRNLVSTLITEEKVVVTGQMAQGLVTLADRLITYAKKGDLHNRRLAASVVRQYIADEANGVLALNKLFSELGPRYATRKGGYTRRLKMAPRLGDNAKRVLVEFVK